LLSLEYENSAENCQLNDEVLAAGRRSVQEKGLLSLPFKGFDS
jgi:hypothetical protein